MSLPIVHSVIQIDDAFACPKPADIRCIETVQEMLTGRGYSGIVLQVATTLAQTCEA